MYQATSIGPQRRSRGLTGAVIRNYTVYVVYCSIGKIMKHCMYPKDSVPHALRCAHVTFPNGLKPFLCADCNSDHAYQLYSSINDAYRKGDPIMNDYMFDMFETYLRERHRRDPRFWKVGQDMSKV